MITRFRFCWIKVSNLAHQHSTSASTTYDSHAQAEKNAAASLLNAPLP